MVNSDPSFDTSRNHSTSGFSHLLLGFQLLGQPQLRAFVIMPVLLSFVLLIAGGSWALQAFDQWTDSLISQLPGWLSWLDAILLPIFSLVMILLFGLTYTSITCLIASPFLGLLAERSAKLLGHENADDSLDWKALMALIPRAIGRELQKLGYLLPRLIGLFVLTMIPPITAVAPLLWFLFGAWFFSLQYLDYCSDNQMQNFKQLRQQQTQNRWSCLTFGGSLYFLLLIPLLNVIVIPAAVIGATSLWLSQQNKATS